MTNRSWWLAGGLAGGLAVALAATPLLVPRATPPASADEGLKPFSSCAQLRDWYVRAALAEVGPWGFGSPVYPTDVVMTERLDAQTSDVATAASMPEDAAVDNGATGTNIQEGGVDEPDIAKTDGRLVYTLDRGRLVISDPSGTVISRLRVAPRRSGGGGYGGPGRGVMPPPPLPGGVGTGPQMLLVDGRVVVLDEVPAALTGAADRRTSPTQVQLTTVDVSDATAPRVLEESTTEGSLVDARAHDGTVRVVSSSIPTLDFVQPGSRRSPAAAERANRQIIGETAISDWLPRTDVSDGLGCGDVAHPRTVAGPGTLVVTTLDPTVAGAASQVGVVADGSLVYASADRLYVGTASGGWSAWTQSAREETEIHAFDAGGATTSYLASGTVPGRVPDRWAMSEQDGLLRLAAVGAASRGGPFETRIHVLREDAGRLVETGSVGGMGVGEDLKAVRWFGDLAVVVTFMQTDPLYTVDLSDPLDPQVVGRLKIAGFSAYLHPVGGNRLLGIGQDADRRGVETASQASLFDLGDPAVPERLATAPLGRGHRGQSPVEDDARAFTYVSATRTAYVPVGGRYGGGNARVAVLAVGADTVTVQWRVPVPGRAGDVRVLPLTDKSMAVIADGKVVRRLG